MASKYEFVELANLVEKSNPKSTEDVRKVLDTYFNNLAFSLLQYEWKNALSEAQKDLVCLEMFTNVQKHKKRKSKLS